MKKHNCMVVSLLVVLMGAAELAYGGCWEVTDIQGKTVRADDVWHLRNVHTGQSALLGTFDGKDTSILLRDVQSIVAQPSGKKRFGIFGTSETPLRITYGDGRQSSYSGDLALTVQVGDDRSEIALAQLRSVIRCDQPVSAGATTATQDRGAAGAEGFDTMTLGNGNVLHGTIATALIHWRSPYALLKIERRHIKSVDLDAKGKGLLETWVGDRISGDLQNGTLRIRLRIGQDLEIGKQEIKSIRFAATK